MTVSDNAIADDQSETRAGAYRFGREKGLEHARLNFRRNARAVVHDLYDYLVVLKRSANADFPCPIYGGDGVINQIGPDLIEFTAISHDARHRAIESANDSHVLQFVAQHGQGALDALV